MAIKIVHCTLGNTKLSYHGGASSMHRHLSAKHDRIVSLDSSNSSASEDPGQRLMDSFVGVKNKCLSDCTAKVAKLVCEMVVSDLHPVNIAQGSDDQFS